MAQRETSQFLRGLAKALAEAVPMILQGRPKAAFYLKKHVFFLAFVREYLRAPDDATWQRNQHNVRNRNGHFFLRKTAPYSETPCTDMRKRGKRARHLSMLARRGPIKELTVVSRRILLAARPLSKLLISKSFCWMSSYNVWFAITRDPVIQKCTQHFFHLSHCPVHVQCP